MVLYIKLIYDNQLIPSYSCKGHGTTVHNYDKHICIVLFNSKHGNSARARNLR